MRSLSRWLAATAIIGAVLVAPGPPASAAGGDKGNPEIEAGCTSASCRARIRVPGRQQLQRPGRSGNPGSSGGSGTSGSGGDEEYEPPPLQAGGQAGCPNGGEYIGSMMYCYPEDPTQPNAEVEQIPTRPPQAWFDTLIASAYSAMLVPDLTASSSPTGEGDESLIAQLPTWLWVDPAEWVPTTVSTPPVFGFWVELTAAPSEVTFSNQDGSVSCGDNEGPVYSGGGGSSDCTLTFRHSTAVGPAAITTEVSWDIAYACLPDCGTGVLPDLATESQRDVEVADLLAIGVAG